MHDIITLINEMSPYLLLGFLLAGVMHTFVPARFYQKFLSRKSFSSVLYAALFGIPLPLCSCGVIPTAMSLRKEGASKGAVTSFLIATPQTGVDSIIATFSLMGLPFAIVRPIAALLIAVFGGAMVDIVDMDEDEDKPMRCCCHDKEEVHACSCHSHQHSSNSSLSILDGFWTKCIATLKYSFVDMIEDIGKWLIVGLLIAGTITTLIPTEYFAIFKDNTFASMLLVLCITIPMYLCATGSIPIALALLMKGLTPGAALVLLIAGPACNFASLVVLRSFLGTRSMFFYIISIVIGTIAFGCLVDWMQFSGMVDFLHHLRVAETCCEHGPSLFQWICTAVLAILVVNALVLPKIGLRKNKSCCHHH
jgi:uncharacterized membrane protein YraQ (UPF0718 family)